MSLYYLLRAACAGTPKSPGVTTDRKPGPTPPVTVPITQLLGTFQPSAWEPNQSRLHRSLSVARER